MADIKRAARKNIALRLFSAASGIGDCVVVADPVNPYAFIITDENMSFRVVIKELS